MNYFKIFLNCSYQVFIGSGQAKQKLSNFFVIVFGKLARGQTLVRERFIGEKKYLLEISVLIVSFCLFLIRTVVFFMSLLPDTGGMQELSFVASEV